MLQGIESTNNAPGNIIYKQCFEEGIEFRNNASENHCSIHKQCFREFSPPTLLLETEFINNASVNRVLKQCFGEIYSINNTPGIVFKHCIRA